MNTMTDSEKSNLAHIVRVARVARDGGFGVLSTAEKWQRHSF